MQTTVFLNRVIVILPRFELGISEPKSDVLPLHHRTVFVALNPPRSKNGRLYNMTDQCYNIT